MLTGGGGRSPLGGLFDRELFEFKPYNLEAVERVTQEPTREQLADFNEDPFASDFNNRNPFV